MRIGPYNIMDIAGRGPISLGPETIAELQARVQGELASAIEEAAALVEAHAKELCPVRTGRLRDSIRVAVIEIAGDVLRAEVGTDVPYAAAVEMGTRHAAAQAFLLPALEACRDEVQRIIAAAVRRALEEVGVT